MNLYTYPRALLLSRMHARTVRTCGISFFLMTYRRDYLDVDPSLRFEPITHREYIRIPFLCSLSPRAVCIGERIDHRCARDFSSGCSNAKKEKWKEKRERGKRKKISRTRLKSHSVVWERKTSLFLFYRCCPSSSTSPFGTRFPRVWINWNSIRTLA